MKYKLFEDEASDTSADAVQKEKELLKSYLRQHVVEKEGITVELVDAFCRAICRRDDVRGSQTPSRYQGTWDAFAFPMSLIDRDYANFILFISPEREMLGLSHWKSPLPAGHFVTFIVRPEEVLYIDPTGTNTTKFHIVKLIENIVQHTKKTLRAQHKRIQGVNSAHCALYAILYCVYYNEDDRTMTLKFTDDPAKNDKLCVQYLKKLIDKPDTSVCTIL